MPYQTRLPAELEKLLSGDREIRLNYIPGYRTRGNPNFSPQAVVDHHTASSTRGGHSPALGICINGRPGLPGPLAQVHVSRFYRDGVDVNVIALGRANHAGRGSWRGLVGNTRVWGIEPENNGVSESWHPVQIRAIVLVNIAMLRASGIDDPSWVCGHYEWTPRKIDPAPRMMPNFRRETAKMWQPGPVDVSEPQEGDEMRTYKPGDRHRHIGIIKFQIGNIRGSHEFIGNTSPLFDDALGVQVRRFQDIWRYSERGNSDWGLLTPELQYRIQLEYFHKRMGLYQ